MRVFAVNIVYSFILYYGIHFYLEISTDPFLTTPVFILSDWFKKKKKRAFACFFVFFFIEDQVGFCFNFFDNASGVLSLKSYIPFYILMCFSRDRSSMHTFPLLGLSVAEAC